MNNLLIVGNSMSDIPAEDPDVEPYPDYYNRALADLEGEGIMFVPQREILGGLVPEDYCVNPETLHLNNMGHETLAKHIVPWLSRIGKEQVAKDTPVQKAGGADG